MNHDESLSFHTARDNGVINTDPGRANIGSSRAPGFVTGRITEGLEDRNTDIAETLDGMSIHNRGQNDVRQFELVAPPNETGVATHIDQRSERCLVELRRVNARLGKANSGMPLKPLPISPY